MSTFESSRKMKPDEEVCFRMGYAQGKQDGLAELAAVKAERDAAVADVQSLMSEFGLSFYEVCAYCSRDDTPDGCFIGDGKCDAKWRGVKPKEWDKWN